MFACPCGPEDACRGVPKKNGTQALGGDVDIEPTTTEPDHAASAVVAEAAAVLQQDEKKNAAQFAGDPAFLAALVKVLGCEGLSLEERGTAAMTARTLAKRSKPFKAKFREASGLEPLVAFLTRCTKLTGGGAQVADAEKWAAWAIANLAVDEPPTRTALRQLGVFPLILAIIDHALQEPHVFGDAAERAGQALDNLALNDPENQEAIALAGGSAPLLALLGKVEIGGQAKLRAAFSVYRLAQHPSNGVPLVEAGAYEALAAAVASGATGLGHSDGVVAAAAALALLPEDAERQKASADKAHEAELMGAAELLVLENLETKLKNDDPTRVMRLRDFTSACRMLSGKLSASHADSFAKKATPTFVQLLNNETWTASGDTAAKDYAALCRGDIANAVVQLLHASSSKGVECLKDESLMGALEKLNGAEDRRLQDAVRSALFKLKDEGKDLQRVPSSTEGKKYDLFLSHKQSDAKDFVRALHTMLTVHGYRCFLDVEFDGELGSLSEIVAQSEQVLFVLTDKVLESPWCIMELTAAVANNVPVTVIKKEGARWVEPDSGLRCLNFPSYAELNRLPEEIRPIFQIKIVEHSDTYYASFIEKLFERIESDGAGEENGVEEGKGPARAATRQPTKQKTAGSSRMKRSSSMIMEEDDTNELMVRVTSLEQSLKGGDDRASAQNFFLGLVVGALLVTVSIAVSFTIYKSDQSLVWDAFLAGLFIGIGVTAALALTAFAAARSRKKKLADPAETV